MTTAEPYTFPEPEDYNGWANFWRYRIGVNVIPAMAREKRPIEDWRNNPLGNWQNEPIPEWLHREWITKNKFKDGMAIITGKVWHRENKKGLYLSVGDSDNKIATDEITSDLSKFAQYTLVERCEDAPDKFHWMIYSVRPLLNKDPEKRDNEKIPWIEIKCLKRIMYCAPGPNKNGVPRRIIGTYEPNTLDTFDKVDRYEKTINDICKKYGLRYLDKEPSKKVDPSELDDKQIQSIVELIQPYYREGVRDIIVFSLSGFLYKTGIGKDSTLELINIFSNGDRKAATVVESTYAKSINEVVGYTRLLEILSQSESTEKAQKVISEINAIIDEKKKTKQTEEKEDLIEEATELIMDKCRFLTIEESKEIRYYSNGIYVPGGDIVIEKLAESFFDYEITNRSISEIKGHIMRRTYHKRAEIDADLYTINLQNGLYNIETGEFKEHSPDYLSISQVILYSVCMYDVRPTCPTSSKPQSPPIRIFSLLIIKEQAICQKNG